MVESDESLQQHNDAFNLETLIEKAWQDDALMQEPIVASRWSPEEAEAVCSQWVSLKLEERWFSKIADCIMRWKQDGLESSTAAQQTMKHAHFTLQKAFQDLMFDCNAKYNSETEGPRDDSLLHGVEIAIAWASYLSRLRDYLHSSTPALSAWLYAGPSAWLPLKDDQERFSSLCEGFLRTLPEAVVLKKLEDVPIHTELPDQSLFYTWQQPLLALYFACHAQANQRVLDLLENLKVEYFLQNSNAYRLCWVSPSAVDAIEFPVIYLGLDEEDPQQLKCRISYAHGKSVIRTVALDSILDSTQAISPALLEELITPHKERLFEQLAALPDQDAAPLKQQLERALKDLNFSFTCVKEYSDKLIGEEHPDAAKIRRQIEDRFLSHHKQLVDQSAEVAVLSWFAQLQQQLAYLWHRITSFWSWNRESETLRECAEQLERDFTKNLSRKTGLHEHGREQAWFYFMYYRDCLEKAYASPQSNHSDLQAAEAAMVRMLFKSITPRGWEVCWSKETLLTPISQYHLQSNSDISRASRLGRLFRQRSSATTLSQPVLTEELAGFFAAILPRMFRSRSDYGITDWACVSEIDGSDFIANPIEWLIIRRREIVCRKIDAEIAKQKVAFLDHDTLLGMLKAECKTCLSETKKVLVVVAHMWLAQEGYDISYDTIRNVLQNALKKAETQRYRSGLESFLKDRIIHDIHPLYVRQHQTIHQQWQAIQARLREEGCWKDVFENDTKALKPLIRSLFLVLHPDKANPHMRDEQPEKFKAAAVKLTQLNEELEKPWHLVNMRRFFSQLSRAIYHTMSALSGEEHRQQLQQMRKDIEKRNDRILEVKLYGWNADQRGKLYSQRDQLLDKRDKELDRLMNIFMDNPSEENKEMVKAFQSESKIERHCQYWGDFTFLLLQKGLFSPQASKEIHGTVNEAEATTSPKPQ